MFTDRVNIHIAAGKGGNGVVAWRREKFIPKGGPCGGNGGKGGSVIIETDAEVYSLEWFRNRRILKADNGQSGASNDRQGKSGTDLILKVPCGTLIKDVVTGEVLHDLVADKQRVVVCQGGRGGQGNTYFKTPTNRAPNICTPGREGQKNELELELKLIADVGLVGFPNGGKSTFISAVADVKVKIAPYPFTTLRPNLGFIQKEDYTRIFIADIPGIIQGAHCNRGLGFEFLRHIERTKLLLFVLDGSGIDGRLPTEDFKVLRNELAAYNTELLNLPYLVLFNKIDAEDSAFNLEMFRQEFPDEKNLFVISAQQGDGIQEVLKELKRRL